MSSPSDYPADDDFVTELADEDEDTLTIDLSGSPERPLAPSAGKGTTAAAAENEDGASTPSSQPKRKAADAFATTGLTPSLGDLWAADNSSRMHISKRARDLPGMDESHASPRQSALGSFPASHHTGSPSLSQSSQPQATARKDSFVIDDDDNNDYKLGSGSSGSSGRSSDGILRRPSWPRTGLDASVAIKRESSNLSVSASVSGHHASPASQGTARFQNVVELDNDDDNDEAGVVCMGAAAASSSRDGKSANLSQTFSAPSSSSSSSSASSASSSSRSYSVDDRPVTLSKAAAAAASSSFLLPPENKPSFHHSSTSSAINLVDDSIYGRPSATSAEKGKGRATVVISSPTKNARMDETDADVIAQTISPFPSRKRDVQAEALRQLLDMFPDAEPSFLRATIIKTIAQMPVIAPKDATQVSELVAVSVLEMKSYPKVNTDPANPGVSGRSSNKGSSAAAANNVRKPDVNYWHPPKDYTDIPTDQYRNNCTEQLLRDFPSYPKIMITEAMIESKFRYAPAFRFLRDKKNEPRMLKKARKYGKGESIPQPIDVRFLAEYNWVLAALEKEREEADLLVAQRVNEEEYEKTGNMIECGCCFSEFPFESMVQCEGGHLFCKECARRACENEIGLRRTALKCMDSSGCKERFPKTEIKRFLPEKIFEGWMRIVQEEEIKKANISDLVECPFCPYAQIMPNPDDKIFVCENPECRKRSCRLCKEPDHIPLKCSEVEKQSETLARKKVEEAMTEALLRICPKCNNRFYKTEGCNKMTCTCGTMICYICRAVVKNYQHFVQVNPGADVSKITGCPLYDDTVSRNDREVDEAARRVLQAVQQETPEVRVAIPKVTVDNPMRWNQAGAPAAAAAAVAMNRPPAFVPPPPIPAVRVHVPPPLPPPVPLAHALQRRRRGGRRFM